MGQPQNEDLIQRLDTAVDLATSLNEQAQGFAQHLPGGWKHEALKDGIEQPNEVTLAAMAEADKMIAAEAERLRIQALLNDAIDDGRKLVTVREITEITDIPGADLIKRAQVEGWPVVVKAGEFQVGDKCVFFEVDSYLPMSDPRFKFLEKNATNWQGVPGARLKTIRLRKQLSQGLALPLSLFPEIAERVRGKDGNIWEFKIPGSTDTLGESDYDEIRKLNFTGPVGIMKWEKVINAQLAGMAKGSFPSFLRKSDQERCQNMGSHIFGYDDYHATVKFNTEGIPEEALLNMMAKGELVAIGGSIVDGVEVPNYYRVHKAQASRDTRYEVSLKMDGSSMTVYCRGEGEDRQEGVCSRNLDLKMEGNEDNAFVQMALNGILEALGEAGADVAIQGELMGPGIQGNRENFAGNRFFIYNVFDIKDGEFLTPQERMGFVNEMRAAAAMADIDVVIEHVPVLHNNVTLSELGIHNMEDLLNFAVGPSMSNPVREGLVFKAMDGTHQFKAISNLYLEQEK